MINDLGMGIVITLRDMFSGNAARVQSSMDSLDASVAASSERMTRNLDRIQKGTMLMGAGLAMMAMPTALIASTASTQKALGEMASLGTKDLQTLEDAAEAFSNQWAGASKADFIGACYDVKSALSSLSDEAVGTFGAMAAITAKATKATVQEMVGTFTTGYGIFKPIMKQYSDMDWAKAFSGAMAQTVAAFKTTGPQMAEAIKNIGATAAASNVPLNEQLAILGQLQTTMPGSEAGTLYKAFIMKAAEAGKELGLPFVDVTGRLKGIIPILQEIQNRFPDLSQAGAQVLIKKAFGSDEAVKFILQMSAGMDSLGQNIRFIETAMKAGTATTEEMARAMNTDIGSRFTLARQQVRNLFEMMGRTLLPIVTPVMEGVSGVIMSLQRMAKSMPGVTRAVLALSLGLGAILVVAGAVVAAVGTVGVMLPFIKAGFIAVAGAAAGAGSVIATYFLPVTLAIAAVVGAVYVLRRAWTSNFAGIHDSISGWWNKVRLVFQGIRGLIASFKDGTGEISADLAQKLKAAGLMGFVTTVFRVYTRMREFISGFAQALGHAFGRLRAILEPPVRALVDACMTFYRALFSIVELFGIAGTAADASSFKIFGQVLGTVLGVIAQAGAIILRGLIYPMVFVIRIVALVVRAVVWLGKMIETAFIAAAKYTLKYVLPIRILVEAVRLAARVVYALWQVLTGDISIVDSLKAIGRAVVDFLLTPFRWLRDFIAGIWSGIKSVVSGIGNLLLSIGSAVLHAFVSLPGILFNAGKSLLFAFAQGIWSAVTFPYQVLKRALGWLRRLLPFSDAETGPLSDLTASGAALLRAFANGILSVVMLPAKVVRLAFSAVISAVSKAWGAVTAVGAGIVNAVAWPFRKAASLAASAWGGLKGAAASGWARLVTGGKRAAAAMTAPYRRISTAAGTAWAAVRRGAANAWTAVGSAAATVRQKTMAALRWYVDTCGKAWSAIRNGAVGAWNWAVAAGRSARETVLAPFRWLGERAVATWNALATGFGRLWDGLTSMPARMVGAVGTPFRAVTDTATRTWNSVYSAAMGLWGRMKASAASAGNSLAAPFRAIASGASQGMDAVRGTVIGAWESIKAKVGGVAGAIGEVGTNAVKGVGSLWRGIFPFSLYKGADSILSFESLASPLDRLGARIAAAADMLAAAFRAVPSVQRVAGPAAMAVAGLAPALPVPPMPVPVVHVAAPQPDAHIAHTVPTTQVSTAPEVRVVMPYEIRPTAPNTHTNVGVTPLPNASHMASAPQAALGLLMPLPSRNPEIEVIRQLATNVPPQMTELLLQPRMAAPVPALRAGLSLRPQMPAQVPPVRGMAVLAPSVVQDVKPVWADMLPQPALAGPMPVVDFPSVAGTAPAPPPDKPRPVYPVPFAEPSTAPQVSGPGLSARQSGLLSQSQRQSAAPAAEFGKADEVHFIRVLLESAISEIRALAARPIDVSVTTTLDGRKIAQSVYKDLREQKVKNYETL